MFLFLSPCSPIMPKRRADTSSDIPQKPPRNYPAVHTKQEEYIRRNGFVSSFSCEHCLLTGQECVMDQTHRYTKCATCTRQGRLCKKEFHTAKE
jgi:hypothetical protein